MYREKHLLAERVLTGDGELHQFDTVLGVCKYQVVMRKSLLVVKDEPEAEQDPAKERILVAIRGKIETEPLAGLLLWENLQSSNFPVVDLHLTEDFFMQVDILMVPDNPGEFNAYGWVLTQSTPYVFPFLI